MKRDLLSKIIILGALIFFIITGLTPLYSLTQQDINKLINFTDSILKIAKNKGIETSGISFEDYYLEVIEKAYTNLEKLLKENGWTYEEMDALIYKVGVIMSLKALINQDYVIEMLAEEGITKNDIDLVLKNEKKLSQYFIYPEMEDFPDLDDLQDMEDIDDIDDDIDDAIDDDIDDAIDDDIDDAIDDEEYPDDYTDDESPEDAPPPPH